MLPFNTENYYKKRRVDILFRKPFTLFQCIKFIQFVATASVRMVQHVIKSASNLKRLKAVNQRDDW